MLAPVWQRVTSNYQMQPGDEGILVDTTNGPVTISTAVIELVASDSIIIKKVSPDGNAVTVQCTDGENIEGTNTTVLASQFSTAWLIPDAVRNTWYFGSHI